MEKSGRRGESKYPIMSIMPPFMFTDTMKLSGRDELQQTIEMNRNTSWCVSSLSCILPCTQVNNASRGSRGSRGSIWKTVRPPQSIPYAGARKPRLGAERYKKIHWVHLMQQGRKRKGSGCANCMLTHQNPIISMGISISITCTVQLCT